MQVHSQLAFDSRLDCSILRCSWDFQNVPAAARAHTALNPESEGTTDVGAVGLSRWQSAKSGEAGSQRRPGEAGSPLPALST